MIHVLFPDRRLPAVLAALLLVLGLAAAPASAEPEKELVLVDHWFHGETTDQLHKADRLAPGATPFDSRTPTFSENEPDGGTVVQSVSGLGTVHASDHVGSVEAAYWAGEFTGEVGGNLELRLHAFTLNPIAPSSMPVHVTVWADPDWDTGEGALLGEALTDVSPAGIGETELQTLVVPVAGLIDAELVIQVQPQFFNGSGISINYGSAEHDSGFTLPVLVPVED